MDRPVTLLHVVGGENIGDTSQSVKQAVLESEHRCRSDNGGLWEDAANDSLATRLLKIRYCYNVLAIRLTLVRKNSEGESRDALKEERWINRSISYFATASAIRSAPSTLTSSRSKFLGKSVPTNMLYLPLHT